MCIFITNVLDEAESCQIAFRQLGVTVGNRSMYGSESRKAQISWEPAMRPCLETLRTNVPGPFFLVNLEQPLVYFLNPAHADREGLTQVGAKLLWNLYKMICCCSWLRPWYFWVMMPNIFGKKIRVRFGLSLMTGVFNSYSFNKQDSLTTQGLWQHRLAGKLNLFFLITHHSDLCDPDSSSILPTSFGMGYSIPWGFDTFCVL